MAHRYLFSALSEAKTSEKETKKKKDYAKLPLVKGQKILSLEESPLYNAFLDTSLDGSSNSANSAQDDSSLFPLHTLIPVKPSKKWKKKGGNEPIAEENSQPLSESVDTTAYGQSIAQFQALRFSFDKAFDREKVKSQKTSEKFQKTGEFTVPFTFPFPHVNGRTKGALSLHPSSYGNTLFLNTDQIVFDEKKTQADLRRAAPIFQSFLQTPQKILFYSATQQVSYSLALWAAVHWNQSLLAGKWIGGSLTNWGHIVESKKRSAQLQALVEYGKENQSSSSSSNQDKYFSHTRKTGFYQSYRVGPTKPDLLFVFEASSSLTALKEAQAHGIPTMGFSSGKISSKFLTYPISCTEENQSLLSLYLFFLSSFSSSSSSSFSS